MKRLFILGLIFLIPFSLSAQIDIGKKLKNKVNQRIDRKVDKALDEALDTAEGKNDKAKSGGAVAADKGVADDGTLAKVKSKSSTLTSYSKFDFVPGEKVIFYDNFAKDRLGEFPDYWLTNGMGQTVKLEGSDNQWLQLSKNSRYAPDKSFAFPEDYTVEFDLIMAAPEERTLGTLTIMLAEIPDKDNPMAAYSYKHSLVNLHMGWNASSLRIYDTESKINNSYGNNVLQDNRGVPVHVSIAVNGQRYRMWVNEQKVFDVPQLMVKGAKRNYIFFETSLTQEDPEYQVLISNFRVAEGKPDLRKALERDGKFVTRGITFDSGSDVLKPESFGVLRKIAGVMQEDEKLRIRIVGHTDSDGAADYNVNLSKRRADAIKLALTDSFKIDGNRFETDGKGASEPVDSNTSEEGKANNRRAEFIKL